MSSNWVIFNSMSTFNLTYKTEAVAQPSVKMPIYSFSSDKVRKLSDEYNKHETIGFLHPNHPSDQRIVTHIEYGWRQVTKDTFTFKTDNDIITEGWTIAS